MTFHRFEDYKARAHAIHLTTAQNRKIEGDYMFFCHVTKAAGTGSELHYHPNELLTFILNGKANVLVGKERRIVPAGTFVHIPPCARHSIKASEDGDMQYLYIKDQTWSMVGVAADEALPDEAPDVEEVAEKFSKGEWPGQKKSPEESGAIIEGLANCFYPVIESFDAPTISCERTCRIAGERLAFNFADLPEGYHHRFDATPHEEFIYLLKGELTATVGGEKKNCVSGDVIQIPKGSKLSLEVTVGPVRYVSVESTTFLEGKIDRKM
ncbi:MAG: cupin domain-containing protein [Rhodospirillales bacterium]